MIHFKRLDHILMSIPEGQTAEARAFYSQVLGLSEIAGYHPGGAIWFQIADIQLHLREEAGGNLSARHPAFEVADLDQARQRLTELGVAITFSSDIDGRQRFFIRDPFGNRIEFLQYDEAKTPV
ncbi:VOC family protein [Spirosoma utsteinense]|uniref:Catechol 2,3-dioxygenase-like lactoylglutathione lyase family enzyme n=1 Tax=Spirosoma utsteinense TaxID=2585773 RepID=A0ABR6W6L5_9BACT|nr:VOC family protein [Spirosoma utsteinense]MBC3787546.1 catechol 2,3-dioxygenase-like lactoylglutathione lyase family enzyme [Spirosoma utsteinense]MBC3792232.1 catechol 2,3-dioxygenase-like lactoylglutathione lyase family enzyme [Spirosoma utsteinense]